MPSNGDWGVGSLEMVCDGAAAPVIPFPEVLTVSDAQEDAKLDIMSMAPAYFEIEWEGGDLGVTCENNSGQRDNGSCSGAQANPQGTTTVTPIPSDVGELSLTFNTTGYENLHCVNSSDMTHCDAMALLVSELTLACADGTNCLAEGTASSCSLVKADSGDEEVTSVGAAFPVGDDTGE